MQQEEQSGLQVRTELIKVHREFMEMRTKLKNLEKRHKLLMKLDREYNPKPKPPPQERTIPKVN